MAAAAGEYTSAPGGCVGYVQRDGSKNRAYSYDVYDNCSYLQVRHKYLTTSGGVTGYYWTPYYGTAGRQVFSATTSAYKAGSECQLVTNSGVGYTSSAC